jgi:hypothetical protein
MSKQLTNEDLIKNLMNYSPYGGLCQAFIMQGLETFCDEVISRKEEMIKEEEEMMLENRIPIVSVKGWVGIAEDIKERIRFFYDQGKLKY